MHELPRRKETVPGQRVRNNDLALEWKNRGHHVVAAAAERRNHNIAAEHQAPHS
jgi:hypothetical protein